MGQLVRGEVVGTRGKVYQLTRFWWEQTCHCGRLLVDRHLGGSFWREFSIGHLCSADGVNSRGRD